MRRLAITLLLALVVAAAGCAGLPRPPAAALAPGPPTGGQAVPRTLTCEVFALRVADTDPVCSDDLWRYIDEQTLPNTLRQRLAANGLRAGIVSDPPPDCLAEKLAPAPTADELTPAIAQPPRIRSLLRLLPAQESELVAAAGPQSMVILEHDGSTVTGAPYEQATGVFTVTARPVADGRLRLAVTPLVKHGAVERTWAGADGAFRLEAGQRRHAFDGLRLEAELADHQALVIAGDGPAGSTVGDAFLREQVAGQSYRRILVIRPLARGLDPRFTSAGDDTAVDRPDAVGDLEELGRR